MNSKGTPQKRTLQIAADSISMHYGPYLTELLFDSFVVDRKAEETAGIRHETGTNGGDSTQLLSYLRLCEELKYDWDFLLINAGLHDIRRRDGKLQTEFDQYMTNVEDIISVSKKIANTTIWVNTTPVSDVVHNSIKTDYFRYNEDVKMCNKIAYKISNQHNVPTIDLYSLTDLVKSERTVDHIHYTDEIRLLQASNIAGWLKGFAAEA